MDTKGWGQRASLALVPTLYSLIARPLFASCRTVEYGAEHYGQLLNSGQPFIAAIWHYSVLFAMQRMRGGNWAAMVSSSDDAEYVARFLQGLGFDTVRGSRNRRGVAALKAMVSMVKDQGRSAAIVADGSQGPALIAQAGAILLASKTGVPILPIAFAADQYWSFNSWDRTMVPKPFARLVVCFGEPLAVPAKLSSEQLERLRVEFERRLQGVYAEAWAKFGRAGHYLLPVSSKARPDCP